MDVRMKREVLSPGVQDGQKADARAQMLWIGRNFQQGLRHCLEQDAVDHTLVVSASDHVVVPGPFVARLVRHPLTLRLKVCRVRDVSVLARTRCGPMTVAATRHS